MIIAWSLAWYVSSVAFGRERHGHIRAANPQAVDGPAREDEGDSGQALGGGGDDLIGRDEQRRDREAQPQPRAQRGPGRPRETPPAAEEEQARSHEREEDPFGVDDA